MNMQGYGYGGYPPPGRGGFSPAMPSFPGYGAPMSPQFQMYPMPQAPSPYGNPNQYFQGAVQSSAHAPQPQPQPQPAAVAATNAQISAAPVPKQAPAISTPAISAAAAVPAKTAAPATAAGNVGPPVSTNRPISSGDVVRFLNVTVYSGGNIPKMDAMSETDPYVQLEVGKSIYRTATIDNGGENPQWREDFSFALEPGQTDLKVTLFDEDVGKNERIGSFLLNFEEEIKKNAGKQGGVTHTITDGLTGRDKKNKPHITLLLEVVESKAIREFKPSDNSNHSLALKSGILTVWLMNAEQVNNLTKGPKLPELGDPYVVTSLGGHSFRSSTVKSSNNPAWKEKMRFLVDPEIIEGALRFSVYDEDFLTQDVCMGLCEIGVTKLIADIQSGSTKEVPFKVDIKTRPGSPFPNEKNGSLIFKASFEDYTPHLTEFYTHWFTVLDMNHDKHLDHLEFEQFVPQVSSKNLSADELRALFDDIDKDKNKKLDKAELSEYFSTKVGNDFLDKEIFMAWMAAKDKEKNVNVAKGGFVTEDQAVQGFFKNTSDWMDSAGYNTGLHVGHNAKHILIWNRETKMIQKETINPALNLGMRVLYQGATGAALRAIARQTRAFQTMSEHEGREYDKPQSVANIPGFVNTFSLNMDEALVKMDQYKSFNDFFARKLKPEARPIFGVGDPNSVAQPTDCRLMVFPTINDATRLWIKGKNFSIENLLGSKHHAQRYAGGSVSVHRLAPQDYHRFHSPIDATILGTKKLPGQLWTVNPVAVNAVDIFTENKRNVTYIKSDIYGVVAYINVGAHMVGTIVYTGKDGKDADDVVKGSKISKGQDLGYFKFGGSTVICVWEQGRINFDKDLVAKSEQSTETLVKMGESLGRPGPRARQPSPEFLGVDGDGAGGAQPDAGGCSCACS